VLLLKQRDREPEMREWVPMFPLGRWFDDLFRDADDQQLLKVEEFTENGTIVIRADMPGLDPDKDVDVTIEKGVLHIAAHRTEEQEKTEREFHRREIRYGEFVRSLVLPEGIDDAAIAATYENGILEVRVPIPTEPVKEPARQVPVTHS
jgi:HSP20 family protein